MLGARLSTKARSCASRYSVNVPRLRILHAIIALLVMIAASHWEIDGPFLSSICD